MRTQSTLPISKEQIKAIKTAQCQRGLADEDYRTMLWTLFRVTSCTQLSQAQAGVIIDRLNGRETSPPPIRSARPVQGRAHTWRRPGKPRWPIGQDRAITPAQQDYLNGLFDRLGWDRLRRDAFCQKRIGKPWPQTNREVTSVLQVLRPLVQRYPRGYERGAEEGA